MAKMDSHSSEGFVETILFRPVMDGANRLCISTPHATPSMVSWLLTAYEERKMGIVSVELVVESAADGGIDSISHEGFKELQKKYPSEDTGKFTCCYLHQLPKADKTVLIWLDGESPIQAFSCSYEFTQGSMLRNRSGFYSVSHAANAYRAFIKKLDRTIYCNHSEVEEYILISPKDISRLTETACTLEKCDLPLITKRTGEPGKKSGLNWGQRNKRNRNEAYIPIPRKIAKSGFFPLDKQHFLVITDDHHTLQLRVEQQGDKAITTPASNAQLGEYFRNRLCLANGAFVTTADLKRYGRTDVRFYKIDEEQYFMDFTPNLGGSLG